MKLARSAIQWIFYLLILAVFLGQAVSAGFTHDENQFIAPGQLLADHGLLPYVDYPYTHMPYGAVFYAASAKLSNYDFLAGRALNALAWFICSLLIVKAFRRGLGEEPFSMEFLWQFVVVYVFISGQILAHVVGNALNHSLATVFGLLALALFMRAVHSAGSSRWTAFGAGACACIAGLIRFNYVSLVIVLAALLLLHGWMARAAKGLRPALHFAGGVLASAVPGLALFVLAPSAFLYGNVVYIRLNTLYYEQQLYRVNMQLGQKLTDFYTYVLATPVDLVLYALLFFMLVRSIIRYVRSKSTLELNRLALAGCALALALTAFAPSPTQPQYFLAPIPFMCVLLYDAGHEIYRKSRLGLAVCALVLLVASRVGAAAPNPFAALPELGRPSHWIPLQAHDFAEQLHSFVPHGRILGLLPMLPLEAGFDVYPFAATGPFSWRTSLLLTPERRAQYGVTSPEELSTVLQQLPPDGILTGFESTNAGFQRNDLGGLETPFIDYARARGFTSVSLAAPFLDQPATLWIKQP